MENLINDTRAKNTAREKFFIYLHRNNNNKNNNNAQWAVIGLSISAWQVFFTRCVNILAGRARAYIMYKKLSLSRALALTGRIKKKKKTSGIRLIKYGHSVIKKSRAAAAAGLSLPRSSLTLYISTFFVRARCAHIARGPRVRSSPDLL